MPDLFQRGAEWLNRKMGESASRSVTYRRGETEATVTATVSQSVLRIADGAGSRVERTERDYLFSVADLLAAGITMPPARDDRVIDGEGESDGQLGIWEARPGGTEPVYRWCDGSKTRVRVHCKRIGAE